MNDPALRRSSAHVVVADVGKAADPTVWIGDDVEHHLRRVLRLRVGETVTVTDLVGAWRTTVVAGSREHLALEVSGDVERCPPPEPAVTVAAAIPKGDRFDWMVQKLTELGVDRLVLLHAQHSATRWDDERASTHRERAERIALEACRQSRRVWAMAIEGPADAVDVLGSFVVAEPGGRPLGPGDHAVAIGPEGGWSQAEIDAARGSVALGAHILRVETAALAAAALCASFRH